MAIAASRRNSRHAPKERALCGWECLCFVNGLDFEVPRGQADSSAGSVGEEHAAAPGRRSVVTLGLLVIAVGTASKSAHLITSDFWNVRPYESVLKIEKWIPHLILVMKLGKTLRRGL